MSSYEKPSVVVTSELAEGVYAASGDCWDVTYSDEQDWNGQYHVFEIKCIHDIAVEHISASSTVTINFNYNIAAAVSENGNDISVSCSGNTVTLTRTLLADAYKSGDKVTYKLFVNTGDEATTRALAVMGINISCEKTVNVQGGGADGS